MIKAQKIHCVISSYLLNKFRLYLIFTSMYKISVGRWALGNFIYIVVVTSRQLKLIKYKIWLICHCETYLLCLQLIHAFCAHFDRNFMFHIFLETSQFIFSIESIFFVSMEYSVVTVNLHAKKKLFHCSST